jgi:hypothetical protein
MAKANEALAAISSSDSKTLSGLAELKEKVLAGNATDADVQRVEDALNGELAHLSNALNADAGNDLNEPDNQAVEPDVSVTPEKPESHAAANTVTADDPSVSPKGDVQDDNAPGVVTDPETGEEPSTPLGDDAPKKSSRSKR